MAGALAGSATVLLTNPIWVVNTRMTARKQDVEAKDGTEAEPAVKRPTTVGTLIQLLKAGGPAALFAGVIPALVLVINPILQYTIFEKLSQLLLRHRLNKLAAVGSIASASIPARITPRDAFYLGALGKVVATSVTYPYLTVKSRMHVADKDDKKESMFSSLRRIVDEEGYTGLYKGIGPKMAQSVITAAFLFAFKDALYDASLKLRQNGTLKGAIGKVVEKGAAVASATA